jgi:hypothetical protein
MTHPQDDRQARLAAPARVLSSKGVQITRWIYDKGNDQERYGFLSYVDGEESFTGFGEAVTASLTVRDWSDPTHVERKFKEAGFVLVAD